MGFDGSLPNGFSADATLSANGELVAFISAANNLRPGQTDAFVDVFVTRTPR
jgi:hypothetical protein